MAEEYRPRIVGFLCNWCSYGGADRAGAAKLDIPDSVSVVRVMCSSRVEPSMVINALLWGADGVLIAGCHPGDCHYKEGNYYTRRRMAQLRKVLEQMDLDPDRVELAWVSASEGQRYAEVVRDFTEKVGKLGPNPLAQTPF